MLQNLSPELREYTQWSLRNLDEILPGRIQPRCLAGAVPSTQLREFREMSAFLLPCRTLSAKWVVFQLTEVVAPVTLFGTDVRIAK